MSSAKHKPVTATAHHRAPARRPAPAAVKTHARAATKRAPQPRVRKPVAPARPVRRSSAGAGRTIPAVFFGPELPIAQLTTVRVTILPEPVAPTRAVEPGPVPAPEPAVLPEAYGLDRLVLMVRDPAMVFAYWEVTPPTFDRRTTESGIALDGSRLTLRMDDVTADPGADVDGPGGWDVVVDRLLNNWYLPVPEPARAYRGALGLRLADGRFLVLVRSNVVRMPPAGPSPIVDASWMLAGDAWNRLFGPQTRRGRPGSPGQAWGGAWSSEQARRAGAPARRP